MFKKNNYWPKIRRYAYVLKTDDSRVALTRYKVQKINAFIFSDDFSIKLLFKSLKVLNLM